MTFEQWWEKVGRAESERVNNDMSIARIAYNAGATNECKSDVTFCDACKYPTNPDGTCKRSQCCNSE